MSMLSSLGASWGAWGWLTAAAVLLIAEIVVPGIFLLWLGIAALIVGLVSFVIDWSWQLQWLAFALISLAAIPLWRKLARVGETSDRPFLNRRLEEMVGRVFTLERPIVGGAGTIAVDDTVWRITGADAPAGTRIRIARVDGATIHVERAED
ncbi:membrane protein implicated in regulation of membrane protease activity [Rhodoplanes tepidamans]|uniref:NfeD family protein n=1 Tax=Rhodoplanes TaxID=29407 RepID=UPI0027887016|nr:MULTISPECIES: NfeD family protein [Rhodoplanes]MDQ0354779.1 membrane protein implicated in regulation of membrane protease activity [Rhodoplanes tepidamans]